MSSRTTKRSIPPTPSRRTTRRSIASLVDVDAETTQFGPIPVREPDGGEDAAIEPAASARPTRRDLAVPEIALPRTRSRSRGPRGEFSISSARGIAADEVAGSIEVAAPTTARRRRPTTQQRESVRLVSATKREITIELNGKPVTLERQDALALAKLIATAFS